MHIMSDVNLDSLVKVMLARFLVVKLFFPFHLLLFGHE